MSYISSQLGISSTCPGIIMVQSMTSMSGRLPANSYFASANPPRLERVTTRNVWVEARNSELNIHARNGSRSNSSR
jgi:hypothetical protein